MKRIFVNYPVSDSIASCFCNDYYESLIYSMDLDEYGFMQSKGIPINLISNGNINQIPIPGWDLGNGNILSMPTKICECCQTLFEHNVIVAFSTMHTDRSGIHLSIVSLNYNDFTTCERNAFDYATIIFQYDCGFNSNINIDGSVINWREYPSDNPNTQYTIHTFNLNDFEHNVIKRCDNELSDCFDCWPKSNIVCHHELDGLKSIILFPNDDSVTQRPAIVVCPGGPHSQVPQFGEMPIIADLLINNGFIVIYPLRRGISGMGKEWEEELIGNYGVSDVKDILTSITSIIKCGKYNIAENKIGLYGGSYGGYNALLIAGKYNQSRLFKAVCCHCGVYDLITYPHECLGSPHSIMMTYGGTQNEYAYKKRVEHINPASYVLSWVVPTLLVHTINDTATWFGQSVKAYNDSLKFGKDCSLILAPGTHSYGIPNGKKLLSKICEFFKVNLS